ncbi:unnamed protein product [Fusarium graminearum]|uniref:Chromosome 4, complete genome n=2 Tax=Gibberella zeae (strain ATCC MYA-4620 / CBS 123657 / FGSC 9075 / NRRL 31084 / PH-1) TaxID=229533 RepID=A0A0E0SDY2_GIBZE|nr:hypothetical protein FG05_09540 [Fusarium graminearum]CEF84645.1 unnamed protein product [Fusarium graminearum]
MEPNDSSSNALSSLYEAIGLSEGDTTMRCFGQAQGDTYCVTPLPKTRKPTMKRLLQNLARYELGSECPDAALTVEMTLAELTKNLICFRPIKPHAVKFEIHRKSYKNNMEYVYFLLTSKFESWQLERKAEKQRNNRQHTPTRTLQKSLTKLNGHESNSKNVGRSSEDAYDSSYGDGEETDDEISKEEDDGRSEEMDDEDVFDTRIREKLQRPKLVRESPQVERDILVTPVRCRREGNRRMIHSGTKAAKDSFESPSSMSPSDDKFLVSPASVTSPDPSELFTPLLTVSTPDSLASTVGFESRRSSSRISHRKRQDASPTRGAESTDLDILSKDIRRKLNLSGSIPGNEEDFDDEGNSDTQSQDSESDKEAATRPKLRQPIIFFPKNQPVHKILKYMRQSPGEKGFGSGYIYGFTDPTVRGHHIKIGYTGGGHDRMEEFKTCEYEPSVEFKVYMPYASMKMEGLIHRTLHMEAEYASCPAKSCETKHREWFKISKREAKEVVEIWKKFSELMPYTETRQLNDIWQGITTAQLAKPWSSDAKVWLKEELLTIVSKEKRLAKLQDNLDKKKQEREGIKQKLLQAEEDEERLRKQLEGLAIGNR